MSALPFFIQAETRQKKEAERQRLEQKRRQAREAAMNRLKERQDQHRNVMEASAMCHPMCHLWVQDQHRNLMDGGERRTG